MPQNDQQTGSTSAEVNNESTPLICQLASTSTEIEKGMTSIWQDFKEFIYRGDALSMAVGIIIGAAFNSIVKSLVDDVLSPPIGLLLKANFENAFLVIHQGTTIDASYHTIDQAQKDGAVTLNYGRFGQAVFTFLITGISVFFIMKVVHLFQSKKAASESQKCKICAKEISKKARRCPFCTSFTDLTIEENLHFALGK
ncbi:hypothetical protein H4219_001790 [Mycoemilia scoparia]|uniref:Large-conductance mechanosensitive channel n=1 Tax=Mycoemilia scoparia TaxID=417184 RepID=A0A9W8DUY3_9FUNG|nr:hypothetical protein H4219_001790 [Mycoemilia scoparia]